MSEEPLYLHTPVGAEGWASQVRGLWFVVWDFPGFCLHGSAITARTLHLASYTLHPTPYTLHPAPYTLPLKPLNPKH